MAQTLLIPMLVMSAYTKLYYKPVTTGKETTKILGSSEETILRMLRKIRTDNCKMKYTKSLCLPVEGDNKY